MKTAFLVETGLPTAITTDGFKNRLFFKDVNLTFVNDNKLNDVASIYDYNII